MMIEYYKKRALEYDSLYEAAAWQADLRKLKHWLVTHTKGRTILEVAAGTGYWTSVAATVAKAIVATDINAETLAVAATKSLGQHVTLVEADAYNLPDRPERFDLGMAHLWWSHVRKEYHGAFLSQFAARLQDRAVLLMIDQNFVPNVSTPLSCRDDAGNSYQPRRLDSGERFTIVKNYYDTDGLRCSLADACTDIDILQTDHFWAVSAHFRAGMCGTQDMPQQVQSLSTAPQRN